MLSRHPGLWFKSGFDLLHSGCIFLPSFYLTEFESKLEASESLEEELKTRLNKTETKVEALKTADRGKEKTRKRSDPC